MPDRRNAHPYYLYDAIQAQPALIEKMLARCASIDRAADAIAEKERHHLRGHRHFAQRRANRRMLDARVYRRKIPCTWRAIFRVGAPSHGLHTERPVIHRLRTPARPHFQFRRCVRRAAAGALTIGHHRRDEAAKEFAAADFHIEPATEISFAYTKSYTKSAPELLRRSCSPVMAMVQGAGRRARYATPELKMWSCRCA